MQQGKGFSKPNWTYFPVLFLYDETGLLPDESSNYIPQKLCQKERGRVWEL
jgi:hypothetical protein